MSWLIIRCIDIIQHPHASLITPPFFCPNTVNLEIFTRILFSQIALRHICDAKNSRLEHGLHISVNDIVVLAFHKDLFSHMRSFTKIKPS